MSQHQLDAQRLLCPMPVIRTQNFIQQLADQDVLEVLCTDPGVLHDIPTWCRINGHQVLDIRQQASLITIQILVCKSGNS